MVFNIPRELDEFLTLGFLFLFLISYGYNMATSGNATLVFLKNEYAVQPEENPLMDSWIQEYANNKLSQSIRAYYLTQGLYWLGIPILCFYYSIFKFKPDMWGKGGFKLKEEFRKLKNDLHTNEGI